MTADAVPGPPRVAQPAAFVDRDGTLIVDTGYLGDPEEVVLVDGAARALVTLRALGFVIVVVTNQSGIARGRFGPADVEAVHRRLDGLLAREDPDARIDAYYWCPHGPGPGGEPCCPCRKPRPGMMLQAASDHDLDLTRSVGIGDSERDALAFSAAGCGQSICLDGDGGPTLVDAVNDVRTWMRVGSGR